MKFFATVAVFITAALATNVSYDNTYDNRATSLTEVACSNGPNGLMSKGYSTFGSLPRFPYIGGSSDIKGFDSASCGTCYKVSYKGKTIYVTAVDHADSGLNLSFEAMSVLTNHQAKFLGRIQATVTKAAASHCGF